VDTFGGNLQLSALGDLDHLLGLVTGLGRRVLDLLNEFVTLEDLAEDDMTTIEPSMMLISTHCFPQIFYACVNLRGEDGGDEELRAIGVLASVCHGQRALLGVLELEVLIGEFVAVDWRNGPLAVGSQLKVVLLSELTGLATGTIALGEVTTLNHEVLDDSVEDRALVAKALLAGGESSEVLDGLRDGLAVEANNNSAKGLITLSDVEVDLVCDLGALRSLHGGGEEQHADSNEEQRRDDEPAQGEHGGRRRDQLTRVIWWV
jgi:hypothetical protein